MNQCERPSKSLPTLQSADRATDMDDQGCTSENSLVANSKAGTVMRSGCVIDTCT